MSKVTPRLESSPTKTIQLMMVCARMYCGAISWLEEVGRASRRLFFVFPFFYLCPHHSTLLVFAAGVEYYFGYSFFCDDLDCEDYRSRDTMWDQSRYALEFFKNNAVPFWEMSNDNSIVSSGWCLKQTTEDVLVVYLPSGSANIDLSSGTYSVDWYDPRNGGALQTGSVSSVDAGNNVALGSAPNAPTGDWVVLLKRTSGPTPPTPPSPPTPNPPTPAPVPAPPTPVVGSIVSFTLVDAASDTDIGLLNDGDTIVLSNTGTQLSVRADSSGSIGSVGFGLDGNANYQTENFAAYALNGNSGSNYFVVSELAEIGQHTITATPYSGSGKSGTAGTPVSITVTTV